MTEGEHGGHDKERRATPVPPDPEREQAIARAFVFVDSIKDDGLRWPVREWITRWAEYVEACGNPLVADDVDDVLAGDGHLDGIATRHRSDKRSAEEQASGWFVEEAAAIGTSAFEQLFRDPTVWTPPDMPATEWPEHRKGALLSLANRIDGRIRQSTEDTLPEIMYERRDPSWSGSYIDATRQITINELFLEDEDGFRATAALIHELAHDTQNFRLAQSADSSWTDDRTTASLEGFAENEERGYVTRGNPGYLQQPVEDDAYRRDALATLRIALMASGHPEHQWLADRTANWIIRAAQGKT